MIVFACIVLFFAILLSFSLTVYVSIQDEVSISIGAFGYRYHIKLDEDDENPQKKKKKKKAKKKPTKEPTKKKTKKPTKKANKFSFQETIEFALTLMKSIINPAVKLLKHVRVTKLSLNMTVCGEEADETAILFGQITTGIYNLLGYLDNVITLKVKQVNIVPDFVSDEAKYDIFFKVKLRFFHIIFALFGMITKFLVNTIKNNMKKQHNEPTNIQGNKNNKRKDIHLKR